MISPHDDDDLSFTPQRRHRKMLKDGSSEVWPESAEKVFMQGLRQYWISPWATVSHGRSRWRNQFLVEHLRKAGIDRTKKQVASHIQVLRNMLKGHPDFRLVAVPEELSLDSAQPLKIRGPSPPKSGSSPASSPSPSTPGDPSFDLAPSPLAVHRPSSSATVPPAFPVKVKTEPLQPTPLFDLHYTQPPRHISSFCLWTQGMVPFTTKLDTLAPLGVISLRIKLSLAPVDSPSVSSSHPLGFQAAVLLSTPWSTCAQCVTKVDAAGACISREVGFLTPADNTSEYDPAPHEYGAYLPDSWLNRCRWLDPGTQTTITQQISVDGVVLAFITYDLLRIDGAGPSAELTGIYKLGTPAVKPDPVPSPLPYPQQPFSRSTGAPCSTAFFRDTGSYPSASPFNVIGVP